MLGVRHDNPTLRLYARLGLVERPELAMTNRAGGTSAVMVWRP